MCYILMNEIFLWIYWIQKQLFLKQSTETRWNWKAQNDWCFFGQKACGQYPILEPHDLLEENYQNGSLFQMDFLNHNLD